MKYIMPERVLTSQLKERVIDFVQEYLVDWIKSNVAEENFDLIIDPNLPELPSIKDLKRILLIGLRCVDLEVEKRPKMGEVLHMLEPRDLLLSDVRTRFISCSKIISFSQ